MRLSRMELMVRVGILYGRHFSSTRSVWNLQVGEMCAHLPCKKEDKGRRSKGQATGGVGLTDMTGGTEKLDAIRPPTAGEKINYLDV